MESINLFPDDLVVWRDLIKENAYAGLCYREVGFPGLENFKTQTGHS